MTYFPYGKKSARRNPYTSISFKKTDCNLVVKEESAKIFPKPSEIKTRPTKKTK